MENNIYAVDYWLPFPASEYGGLCVFSARNTEELLALMFDTTGVFDLLALGFINEDEIGDTGELTPEVSEIAFYKFRESMLDKAWLQSDFEPIGKTDRASGLIKSMIT